MMAKSRFDWVLRRIARQIWFRAALISAASMVVAALAGKIARLLPYEFTGDVGQEAVGTVLQIIASSMLAVTTFSLTAMVSAYSSATQLATPRATQLLISDRTSQNALSTFLGAFIFAVVGIVGLQTHLYGGQGRVVLLLATLVVILLVVVTLLRWIAHLASFGRMADVIDRVEDAACAAMAAFARDPFSGGRPAVEGGSRGAPVAPSRIGYVTHVDIDALGRLASRAGLVVHVEAMPGTLVHGYRPLARIAGPLDDHTRAAVVEAFTIERHRSFDHDPRLGIIALSEIAGRALAPATNDPGTAIEVLNALLRVLSHLPADPPPPDAELPPVHVPRPTAPEFLCDGFLAIIREGAGEEEVAARTFKALDTLERMLPHVAEQARLLADELARNVEASDMDAAAAARALAARRS